MMTLAICLKGAGNGSNENIQYTNAQMTTMMSRVISVEIT